MVQRYELVSSVTWQHTISGRPRNPCKMGIFSDFCREKGGFRAGAEKLILHVLGVLHQPIPRLYTFHTEPGDIVIILSSRKLSCK